MVLTYDERETATDERSAVRLIAGHRFPVAPVSMELCIHDAVRVMPYWSQP
jgi:hypothetical protein